jgi:hypothetical protein
VSAAVAARQLPGVLGTDYRSTEVLVALFVALSVPVWSVVILAVAELDMQADAPAITAGDAVPIRVTPVVDMDSPLLKLGGKKVKAKLPDRWVKPQLPTKIEERTAQVSTKAKDDVNDIPPEDLEVSDAGEAIAPDAEVADQVDMPEDNTDAGEEGSGGGHASGSKHGTETDPLKGRAANQYHDRILRFLKRGFSCPAVPAEVKKTCRPSASVSIAPDGTVTSFSFNACGNEAIDGAARTAISGKVGQQIPPPPEKYKDLRPNSFSVAYVCR